MNTATASGYVDCGYSEAERYQTIRGAVMRYKEMRRKVDTGEILSLN